MKSKTKIMTIAATSLACVAIAGVGFASWVITGTQSAEVNGNVKVETVSDERITLSAELYGSNTSIDYTFKSGSFEGGYWKEDKSDWLIQKALDGESLIQENLSVVVALTIDGVKNVTNGITFTITGHDEDEKVVEQKFVMVGANPSQAYQALSYDDGDDGIIYKHPENNTYYADYDEANKSVSNTISVTGTPSAYTVTTDTFTNYQAALDENLIAGVGEAVVTYKKVESSSIVDVTATPVTATNTDGVITIEKDILTTHYGVTDSTENVTIYLEVTFKWGTAFGSKNPAEYFNTTYANANVASTDTDYSNKNAGDEASVKLDNLYKYLYEKNKDVWTGDVNNNKIVEESETTKKDLSIFYNFKFEAVSTT